VDWQSWVIGIVGRALAFGTPLLWATLGEVYAERSGVVNLGVEGMMILGAFSGFAAAHLTGHPGVGILVGAAVGGAAALLHAFLSVTLRANQYVSGLALTMFGLGLAGLLGRGWEGIALRRVLPEVTVPGLSAIPLLGPMLFQGQTVLTYAGLLLAALLWIVLWKTRWGVVVRSVGESPATADAMGIRVFRVRYLAVLFGGVLAGVAGAYLSVAYRPAWTEGMTAGMGWIAIALTIFSGWDPLRTVGGALLFGALYHLSFRLQGLLPPELLRLMPYLMAIVVLALVGLRSAWRRGAPAALGQPYARGER
jgi:simple sugar transport system permease protein